MAKAKSLLAELLADKPPNKGPEPWHEVFRKTDPDKMAQVDGLIDGYLDGKTPGWSRTAIIHRLIDRGIPAQKTAIEKYIALRKRKREAANAKATH